MSDHAAISSLIATLAWKVDHDDLDHFVDHWLDDATLAYIDVDGNRFDCAGSGEVVALIKASYQPPVSLPCLHIVTTPIIDLDGDRARVRYYTIHTLHGPQARPCGVGEYDLTVSRGQDGQWRVATMTQTQLLAYDRIGA